MGGGRLAPADHQARRVGVVEVGRPAAPGHGDRSAPTLGERGRALRRRRRRRPDRRRCPGCAGEPDPQPADAARPGRERQVWCGRRARSTSSSERGVGHRRGHGSDVVHRPRQGDHAVGRHAAERRLEADRARQRGRHPDRRPGVGAERAEAHARGDGDGRAAARPAGDAGEVVGVAALRVGHAEGELVGRGLGQDDGAGGAEPGDAGGVERSDRRSRRANPPAWAARPTSMTSLTVIGMPCSGPSGSPASPLDVAAVGVGPDGRRLDGDDGVQLAVAPGDGRQRLPRPGRGRTGRRRPGTTGPRGAVRGRRRAGRAAADPCRSSGRRPRSSGRKPQGSASAGVGEAAARQARPGRRRTTVGRCCRSGRLSVAGGIVTAASDGEQGLGRGDGTEHAALHLHHLTARRGSCRGRWRRCSPPAAGTRSRGRWPRASWCARTRRW